jgi:hypothetical protein
MKKFTTLDEELIKENIELAKKFNNHYKECLQKLDIIKIGIDDFAIKQSKQNKDWGYLGSIAYVNEQLDTILEHLNLKDMLTYSKNYNL